MADVLGYLNSKGIPVRNATGPNIHTPCFFCHEEPTKRGRLYINVDPDMDPPGLYVCHRCDARGNLITLKRHFGDPVALAEIDTATRQEILATAADYYHRRLVDYPEALGYLLGPKRGLTRTTVSDYQLGYAPVTVEHDVATGTQTARRPNRLYAHLRDSYDTASIMATGLCIEGRDKKIVDAFAGMVTIPYLVADNVVTIRGRTWPYAPEDFDTWTGPRYDPAKAKYRTLTGDHVRLYNSDACWLADNQICIAEGELDCLTLEQQGFAAVGVPGATIWQDAWDAYFEKVRRVYVVFDRDATGENAATKLLDRLGAKARRIALSEPGVKCDPTDWFATHTEDEFAELLTTASRSEMLSGVDDAIAQFRDVQGEPGIRFGWDLLDDMIAPGFQPGQVMGILAKTGGKKTLLALNLMHRMRMVSGQEDFNVLFISLEQTRGEWWDRARRIHRFYHLDQTEDDAACWWRDHILLVDRNRLGERQFVQVLDDYAYEMGALPDLVLIDYLGYFARGFRGESYLRTSDAIMAVKAVAKEYGVPIVIPHQVNRTASDGQEITADMARDSGVVDETVDFLLTMWSPDDLFGKVEEEKTGEVNLRIAKSRHGGRGALLRMQFAPISLAMVPAGDPFCGQARREVPWARPPRRESWEQAVYRHRIGAEEGQLVGGPVVMAPPKARQMKWT